MNFQCYRRILELDPENIQGLHNLCVVHVERGKLLEAQSCLERAHALAPTEDYVLRHLQIVQNRIVKLKINPNEKETLNNIDNTETKSKVISNKSVDETERKTQPVVSADTEEQRYSSRVVNTEPMFVKNVNDIEYVDDNFIDEITHIDEESTSNLSSSRRISKIPGTDNDDPSSGMS